MEAARCSGRTPGTWLVVLSLVVVVVCFCSCVQPCEATIYGSGAINVQEVFASLTSLYRFYRDNVDITFQTSTVPQALTQYSSGQLDFFISDVGLTQAQLAPFQGKQIPMMGTPLVVAFNLPGFGVNDTIVMDRETLASIWLGDIRQWDDSRITRWNPGVSFPSLNITMTYWSPSTSALGYTAVFKTALSRFLPAFETALANAGGALENMAPSQGPNKWAFPGLPYETGDLRINLTAHTPGMMTYMERQKADSMGLPYIRLINRANKTVDGSPAAVQAAMDLFSDLINNGTLVIDIVDSAAPASWPLSYISYLTISKSINPTTGGCSRASNMLLFLSWTQLNEEVAKVFVTNQFAPLTNPYRRRLINELYTITCQDRPVLTTPVLLGIGEQSELMGDWTQDYQASFFSIKHYAATSADAIQQMEQGDTDYAVSYTWPLVSSSSSAASYLSKRSSNIVGLPAVAYAVAPAYSVSTIVTNSSLVMDMQLVAAIFAGRVTKWTDPSIAALNPYLASLLPNATINLVVGCDNTSTIVSMLSEAFADLADGPAALAAYGSINCTSDPVSLLGTTGNSLGVWFATQVISQVRNVKLAQLVNRAQTVVSANQTCILSAVQDFAANDTTVLLVNGPGRLSWPLVGYAVLTLYSKTTGDYSTAQGLLDWVYWTQTSSQAESIANNYNLAAPGQVSDVLRRTLTTLASITSTSNGGQLVFSQAHCVYNGTICSNRGDCVQDQCSCSSGWTGSYCERASSSSSVSDVLAPVLATVLPVAALLLLAVVVIIVVVLVVRGRRQVDNDWEISYEELQMGDILGHGGYGEVYKAKWKGSEVAVKVMGAGLVSKEARDRFVQEARIMSRLRHPNVVLFMAASTRPPKMCIVMEYMALGSLYDLLHNELIPDIPLVLKVKMIHQAAKGMYFLHSSGIAHRDLKSLNLLLDSKWNVKVSDFGLTSFKESLTRGGKGGAAQVEGSVPWMAPEVLEEAGGVSYELADIYAYGIIMWEVLTRSQPYHGMPPAAIAVGVIRNDLRPRVPADLVEAELGYVELMAACWSRDPTMRPSFDHIMSQLKSLVDLSSGGSGHISGSGTSSSGTSSERHALRRRGPMASGDSLSSSTTSGKSGGSSSEGRPEVVGTGRHSAAPRRDVTFVVCDLARCNESWQGNPGGTAKALIRYGQIVRRLLERSAAEAAAGQGGAEHKSGSFIFSRASLHSGGTFMIAFSDAVMAASFAVDLQQAIKDAKWPKEVVVHPRVSLHHQAGSCRPPADDLTKTRYDPAHYTDACRLNLRCPPGRIICSPELRKAILAQEESRRNGGGRFRFHAKGEDAYSLRLSAGDGKSSSDESDDGGKGDEHDGEHDEEWDERWDQGMGLCSSNWCPWIIDRRKITTGEEIGRGNYGHVTEGIYEGREVAVKQLYKGRLDDAAMVKMRKEAALLSDIDHPHVVKLIGLSVSDGGSSLLVMELVPRGSMRAILSDRSIKLPWRRRLAMLRDAALGIAHLHERGVLHRDIKSSNLLVDDNWSVKVGDFGFATAKQDNGTMTRCGTPSWTAPEIISNSQKHSEKADVYSFAIVMWEMLTREEPYHNKNMTTVAMDVISGERPPMPNDCPPTYAELMQRCWNGKPNKRPDMQEIVMYLNAEAGGADA